MTTQLMFLGQTVALFLVLNAIKCIEHPFSLLRSTSGVLFHASDIVPKFIGHTTFRLASDKDSSRQLLLRHRYAFQNKKCTYFATIC